MAREITSFKMTEMSACKKGMNKHAKAKIIKSAAGQSHDPDGETSGTSKGVQKMDEIKKAIAELKKEFRPTEFIAKMTPSQRAAFDELSKEKQDELFEKDDAEVSAELVKMAGMYDKKKKKKDMDKMPMGDKDKMGKANESDEDPVEYTTADGIEIRKSEGTLAVELAKQVDVLKSVNHSNTVDSLVKSYMANYAGDDDAKREIVSAILKSHPKEEDHKPLLEVIGKQDKDLAKSAGRKSIQKDTEAGLDGDEVLSFNEASVEIHKKADALVEEGRTNDIMKAITHVIAQDPKRYAAFTVNR